jgi:hypothetical protein
VHLLCFASCNGRHGQVQMAILVYLLHGSGAMKAKRVKKVGVRIFIYMSSS